MNKSTSDKSKYLIPSKAWPEFSAMVEEQLASKKSLHEFRGISSERYGEDSFNMLPIENIECSIASLVDYCCHSTVILCQFFQNKFLIDTWRFLGEQVLIRFHEQRPFLSLAQAYALNVKDESIEVILLNVTNCLFMYCRLKIMALDLAARDALRASRNREFIPRGEE